MPTKDISSLGSKYEALKKQFPDIFQTREPKPQPKPDPAKSKPVNGPELLNDLTHFIARFLQCSERQRTILALWVLHTWCHYTAQVTPYLSIQSTDKQSGKTLCLQLLSLLCENPALTSGFTVHKLTARMGLRPVSAILLDECQAIVGTSSRPKTPVLRGLLASGFHRGLGYTGPFEEDDVFCPKAFAGRGPLPEELADRSIPIILQPLQPHTSEIINKNAGCDTIAHDGKTTNANHEPSARHQEFPVERFHHYVALKATEPLCERLAAWSEKHLPVLEKMPPYKESDFPPHLSPRRQDLCEPLLQLAHLIGGSWPARLGEALISIFAEEADFHLQHSRQLLTDLRDCFADNGYPERIQTTTLLDWLHSLPARPWDSEGSMNGYKLARMLGAFDIRPRNQRKSQHIGEKDKPLRGYQLQSFREAWKNHLGFEVPQPEIANKDAVCNTVSHVGKLSVPSNARVAQPPSAVSVVPPKEPDNPAKPAKNAACDTISHAGAASHRPQEDNQQGTNSFVSCTKVGGRALAPEAGRGSSPIPKPAARSQQLEARSIINKNDPCDTISHIHAAPNPAQLNNQKPEMSVDTLHGIHRLKTLHSKLHLQGICPPFEALAASYSPHQLHAALDWVEAHPEWSAKFRYKLALEFVAAFQKTLANLTLKGA